MVDLHEYRKGAGKKKNNVKFVFLLKSTSNSLSTMKKKALEMLFGPKLGYILINRKG